MFQLFISIANKSLLCFAWIVEGKIKAFGKEFTQEIPGFVLSSAVTDMYLVGSFTDLNTTLYSILHICIKIRILCNNISPGIYWAHSISNPVISGSLFKTPQSSIIARPQ